MTYVGTKNRTIIFSRCERDPEIVPTSEQKRIRKMISTYLRTVRVGNKLFVEREELENFLKDPDRDCIK